MGCQARVPQAYLRQRWKLDVNGFEPAANWGEFLVVLGGPGPLLLLFALKFAMRLQIVKWCHNCLFW